MTDATATGLPPARAERPRPEPWWAAGVAPAEALPARTCAPTWAVFADEALAARPAPGTPEPADWTEDFGRVLAPFLDVAGRRLAAAVAGIDGADLPALAAEFRTGLAGRLVRAAARALVFDVNLEREAGRLTGDTREQRFADFVRRRQRPEEFGAFLRRYPVLARILAQQCEHAVAATAELLHRFAADRAAITAACFAGRDPGRLTALETGAGDRHLRGRAVALLRFDSGARLVYKPRPLAVHRHFNEVVEWLNGHAPGLGLRTLTVLDRDGYGWVEFADAQPCADRAAVDRFYHRQGHLLALLYVLDGSDVHYENLIACADQPVLVDLETLFHPYLPGATEAGDDPAAAALARSVYRSALLPQLLLGDDRALDVSGIGGGRPGDELPVPVVAWQHPGTDEMRLVRRPARGRGAVNRPTLAGGEVDPAGHAEPLLAGFRAGYDLIARHRAELLGPDGLLRRFAGDEVRLVARATRLYATLLDESTHPSTLRDAAERDRLFDVLRAGSAGDPARLRLVRHEGAELWQGDVPIFTFRPDGRDLRSGTGEPITGVLGAAPLEQVADKVRRLGEVDRQDQEWVIRAALATRLAHPAHTAGEPGSRPYPASAPDADRLLAAARGVADQIVARGFDDRRRVNWLGVEPLDDRYWAVMPLGAGLATGYTGVALFLAQLAALTEDGRYARVALRALRPLPGLIDRLAAEPESAAVIGCGGFTGFGGIAYALAQVALLLDDREAARLVEPVVRLAAGTLGSAETGDVYDGVAGCLAAMLAVHEMTGLEAALATAHAAARQLLDPAGPPRPATPGFAFGAAGVGWALRRYGLAVGDDRAAHVGREQLRRAAEAARGESWCTGRPGAVLALLDAAVDQAEELRPAVAAVAGTGPLPNHSLCHGEFGRLELLGAAVPLVPGARTAQIERAGLALSAMDTAGVRCGTPGHVSEPGLLTGLAGAGHGLLRLVSPDRVPCALLLQSAGRRAAQP